MTTTTSEFLRTMLARNLLTTVLAASTLFWTGSHFAPEASAVEQQSGLVADGAGKALRLWYDEPAPDSDAGWVNRSIPMGNGYMGANVFGGTTKERIQITENSLYDWAAKNSGFKRRGVNNFAEVYLDFGHENVSDYERELSLNEGVSYVKYVQEGVEYSREYFTSYPDKVMLIRLNASKAGTLSFTLRPTIPFLGDGKSGSVSAEGDTVTLSGVMTYFKIKFEGQFKVIPTGGRMNASSSEGTITVSDADSAVILIAVGTNYQFDPQVFLTKDPADKLAGFPDPHAKVTGYLADAAVKSYEELLANHQADYTELYDRVSLDLGATAPTNPTDELVDAYPDGTSSRYLEELAFQFGRYMLICSSRAGTLPPHLQGIWNVYERPPWSSQYLHDTNVQMAYAPAFSANLPELFESYADFFNVFVHRQREYATQYIEQYNPAQLDPDGDNGWSGPFWANPYDVPGKTPIAGFGTGGWISQMFWDYYDYTRDETLLAETVYPVMYEQANFVSRFVQEIDGALLAKPSSSPEQYLEGKRKRETIGTTFDQQMFYENHHNTLKAAKILGRIDDRLELYESQLPRLDPIHVGKSGQIKEFREEEFYGDAGSTIDPHHRHTSMLLGSYPGQLINDSTPAWLDAVKTTLTLRTRSSNIGWARAERIAFWARVHDGDEAYLFYRDLLEGNYMHNLFNDHRGGQLFQADANYGATAGVAELLLQSQDYVVAPLPALPTVWPDGSYRGLLARGNFEVSAQWSSGQATRLEVLSKVGGTLKLRYPNIAKALIKTADGKTVDFSAKGTDQIIIETTKGQAYVVVDIPLYHPVAAPSNLKIDKGGRSQIELSWTGSADAVSYNLYRAVGNAPDYEPIASDIEGTQFIYQAPDLTQIDQMTLKVTAVRADGRESDEGATLIRLLPAMKR
ncbi:glycoside hydrolase family 95 protein [Aporhodopirellula aestuarii]|uniref:Glycoside hydrolase family 95 protein n=1 Tax=Aporhodopirellula aestuarii TaxID=2950107 RepID=A0ABT0UAQ3_9BACT|nr:glycoside hydrolase family 95 protein [Aporhodopirellula aestuarii]MCM2373949.1 glycoside hydrolase family 95 protein [Aporhodopirellula aestuarii]